MKKSNFFALLSRMKLVHRWGLMRNTRTENLSEHSYETAVIAHCLGLFNNAQGGTVNAEHLAVLGLYHDCSEIITGDMPTPIKYLNNDLRHAYKQVESEAQNLLLSTLPEELMGRFSAAFPSPETDPYEKKLLKAADKLSAYLKCLEELRMGNMEFQDAAEKGLLDLRAMGLSEVDAFMNCFLDGYGLTLDRLKLT